MMVLFDRFARFREVLPPGHPLARPPDPPAPSISLILTRAATIGELQDQVNERINQINDLIVEAVAAMQPAPPPPDDLGG